MENSESLIALAKSSEENCAREVQEVLKKYSCDMSWQEIYVNSQLSGRGYIFKFNPSAFLEGRNS